MLQYRSHYELNLRTVSCDVRALPIVSSEWLPFRKCNLAAFLEAKFPMLPQNELDFCNVWLTLSELTYEQ